MRYNETVAAGVNPPVNTVLPVITGGTPPLYTGVTLTCSTGTWSNTPTSYSYAWLQDGSFISGANASTYVTTVADIAHTISCRVTATNADGSVSATSAATAAITARPPVNTAVPVVTVAPDFHIGSVATTTNGTWTNTPTGFTYQWLSNSVVIAGATASTYTLQASDIGFQIVCRVTASNAEGSNTTPSVAVGPVLPLAPTLTTAPTISLGGAQASGTVATCSTGAWTNTPTAYAYQWKRNGSNIAAATASTYTLQSADAGTTVLCTVTASNAGGSASSDTSNTLTQIDDAVPVNTTAPTVTFADAYPGTVGTVSTGTWQSVPVVRSTTYQWKRNGTNISGATATSYTLAVADIGAAIICSVTATNNKGSTSVNSSNSVARVLWSPLAHIGTYAMTTWLDPSDEANVTEVGGFVTQITDKSGSGAHAVQPTAAVQPARGTPSGWLRKVVQFPGITLAHWMYGAGGSFVGTHSVRYLVSQLFTDAESASNGRFMVACTASGNDADAAGSFNLNRSAATDTIRYNTGSVNLSVPGAGAQLPTVIKTRLDGTNKFVGRDGGTETSIASGYTMNAVGYGLNCGKNAGAAPANYNGTRMHWNMGELISYSVDLPQAELDKLDGYVAWRWAAQLVTALPAGHTYKSAAP